MATTKLEKRDALFKQRIRRWLWKINSRLRERVTVHTKQGLLTISSNDRFIGKALYCDREHERQLVLKSVELLQELGEVPSDGTGTIIDVGANMGVISIGMLVDGLFQRAIAIEPDPYNFDLLRHNVHQNGLEDLMICLPYAVSDRKQRDTFELSDTNYGDHRIHTKSTIAESNELFGESERCVIEVESDRLDHLLQGLPSEYVDTISAIWIDIQGYEGFGFLGAEELLGRGIPAVVEIWPYGLQRAGMSGEEFCQVVHQHWSTFWVMRSDQFESHPAANLLNLLNELGDRGDFENVIFTQ